MVIITQKQERAWLGVMLFTMLIVLVAAGWYYQTLRGMTDYLTDQVLIAEESLVLIKTSIWESEIKAKKTELEEILAEQLSLEDPVELLIKLDSLAQEAMVDIVSVKPGESPMSVSAGQPGVALNSIKLDLLVTGEWHNLLVFSRLVDNLTPFLLTKEIRLNREGEGVKGLIGLVIFYE